MEVEGDDRSHRTVRPCTAVEEKAVDQRASSCIETELHVSIVVGVVRRVGVLDALPPLSVDDLIVLVFARLKIEEVRIDRDENRGFLLKASNHVSGALARS